MNISKSLRRLTLCAILTAMAVVLAVIAKQIFTNNSFFRITFENLPIILAAIYFGPVYGGAIGACSDIITTLLTGASINPFITLGAVSVGVAAGIVSLLCRRTGTGVRILLSCVSGHVIGNMIIKTLALQIMYHAGPAVLVRIPTYMLICACECTAIIFLMKNKQIKSRIEELQ